MNKTLPFIITTLLILIIGLHLYELFQESKLQILSRISPLVERSLVAEEVARFKDIPIWRNGKESVVRDTVYLFSKNDTIKKKSSKRFKSLTGERVAFETMLYYMPINLTYLDSLVCSSLTAENLPINYAIHYEEKGKRALTAGNRLIIGDPSAETLRYIMGVCDDIELSVWLIIPTTVIVKGMIPLLSATTIGLFLIVCAGVGYLWYRIRKEKRFEKANETVDPENCKTESPLNPEQIQELHIGNDVGKTELFRTLHPTLYFYFPDMILFYHNEPIRLPRQSGLLLFHLFSSPDLKKDKTELIRQVWEPNQVVTDNTFRQAIAALREVLKDKAPALSVLTLKDGIRQLDFDSSKYEEINI